MISQAHERLVVDGVEIAYRVVGSGDPLVLVHSGTGTGDFDWRYQVPALAERYRLIIPDLRGHGESSTGPLTVHTMASDLDRLCQHVDAYPAHFLAASHGSFPVLRVAMEVPGAARSVAVVGCAWHHEYLTESFDEQLFETWPRALRELHGRHGPNHWADLLGQLIRDRRQNIHLEEQDFARLSCPLLVVQGENDQYMEPALSARAARAARDGHLFVVPCAGHAAHVEAPDVFNAGYDRFLGHAERHPMTGPGAGGNNS